jgi:predicted alpha/beta-hydrolase family hydrolase
MGQCPISSSSISYNRRMREYPTTAQDAPTLVLAHGAGAGHDHPWMRRVAEGLAARGVRVVTFNFPYTEAGRKVPDRGPVLEEAYSAIWREVAASANGPAFAGGKSMGGRMASHVAARHAFTPPPAGLIFFGYPLHPPGKPEQRRDKHLAAIDVQMLFLSGTTDPFGSPDELRELMKALPLAALELFDGGDHSIVAGRRADPNGQLLERAMDTAAGWMRTHTNYA